ncbi:hypothetical protein BDF14DRAFT_1846172 [Spinellus fusiger]|nr:hypothetical protein BDF14DRAFT_1846172 [Spinellus fusiger]
MHICFVLFAFVYTAYALPIAITPVSMETDLPIDNTVTLVQQDIPFNVNVDRFSQLISTHLQFDHLDSIMSGTYKEIAVQFQHHIHITIQDADLSKEPQPISLTTQHTFQAPSGIDAMDLGVLKAQIFGAIQAHTEGNLPLAWDQLADKLGRPALESFSKQLVLSHCDTEEVQGSDQVPSECLSENAILLSSKLDQYINEHLVHIFRILDSDVLPAMLKHTSKDLRDVLDYFNAAFLQDDQQKLVLQVKPWTKHNDKNGNAALTDRLMALANHSTSNDDNHPMDFFSHYATLAKA